jgi:hypothetical protein
MENSTNNNQVEPKSKNKTSNKKGNWFSNHKVLTGILGIIVLIIILSVATGGGNSKNNSPPSVATSNTSAKQSTSTSTKTPSTPATSVPTRQVQGTAVTLGAGTFSGGKDVAEGLYDVTPGSGQSGNFMVSGTDSYNEILGGDSSTGGVPKVRAQISSGDTITISSLSSVTFTPVTAPYVTSYAPASLYAGTFKVGQDIGPGRYVAAPGSGQSGNFMVDGSNSYNEILGGDSSLGEVPSLTVNLSNGDTITISSLSQVTLTPSN